MPAVLFATKPLLRGETVLLRPFTPADIDAIGPVLADPEVLRLTGSVHSSAETPTAELDEGTRAWYETREAQTNRLDLAVVDLATEQCVGEVVLNDWQPENQACNFRVLIGPGGRDRGLGSEATQLVIDHAFGVTDLYRIELGVYAFNPRAQHVYARAGFVVEGRRRAAFRFDGERVDEIVMAVLRDDWARSRAHRR